MFMDGSLVRLLPVLFLPGCLYLFYLRPSLFARTVLPFTARVLRRCSCCTAQAPGAALRYGSRTLPLAGVRGARLNGNCGGTAVHASDAAHAAVRWRQHRRWLPLLNDCDA